MRAENSSECVPRSGRGSFPELLTSLFPAVLEHTGSARFQLVCRATRRFFGAEGACYWAAERTGELRALEADGDLALRVCSRQLGLEGTGIVADALSSRRARYAVKIDSSQGADLFSAGVRSMLAAPVNDARGIRGVLAVFSSHENSFDDAAARQVSAIATILGSLLSDRGSTPSDPSHRRQAEGLIRLAMELRTSPALPELVRRFTRHATELVGAAAGALVLAREERWETFWLQNRAGEESSAAQRQLASSVADLMSGTREEVIAGKAAELLGESAAKSLGWQDLIIVGLTDGSGEPIGVFCLANGGLRLASADYGLLKALASHVCVALENAKLLSLVEQSRRHWVEDFDALQDLIVVHDAADRILRVNRPLAERAGKRPAELIGENVRTLRILSAEESAEGCPYCRNRRAAAEEYLLAGKGRTHLVSTSRIRQGDDSDRRTIHVLKDITETQEAERRYRELFDAIQEGLFFCTPSGRFIDVNDALVRMLGYRSREELLQINLFEQPVLRPDAGRQYRETLEREGALRNYEVTLRRRDGTLIHTLQNLLAVRDADGKIVQYRGLMLDVTEQKVFQAQLQRERDFNRNILNHTQSMILVLDTAGLISYANRRCLEAGYREVDLLGKPLLELVPDSHRQVLAAALQANLEGKPVDNLELPLLVGPNRAGRFSINLGPMRDDRGQVNSIVTVMTDVTDAAILQGKLMRTEKMAAIGQLVAGVAHEVNNPLAAIVGFTDLALENPEVPESAKEELRVILEEAERTRVIVQNLLSFARQVPAQREPVQLNSILRQTLKLRAYDFASHGVEVQERLGEGLPLVLGDRHALQQVFLNILNNAYDAVQEARRPGRIEIESQSREKFVEVVFRDNGPGISHPDRIFEPFFTTKEAGKGTGLGLSICYGILRAHQGEVLCSNNPDGIGCAFVVRLPAATIAAPAPAEVGR